MTKICSDCGDDQELVRFAKNRATKSGYGNICKTCLCIRSAIWQKENKDKVAKRARRHKLKNKYGITEQDYIEMSIERNFKCEICNNEQIAPRKLVIDHDHKTGKFRALLCRECNAALGLMKENIKTLKNAIKFLEKNAK